MGREGQHRLTWVNVWIKMINIIVLKLNSGVDLRKGLGHGLGRSTRLTQYFFKKNSQRNLVLTNFLFPKSQWVFHSYFILTWLIFFTRSGLVNHYSIFSKTRTSLDLRSTCQVSPGFIIRVIIILIISTLNIN